MAKVAGNADEAARLVHEADQLEAARHPGVVELIGVDGLGVGSILLTAHVEGPALAQVGRLPLEEGAGLLAALASTLADLHDLDLVHGAVSPDHVIVGPGGRPVLCGFAYGGRRGGSAGPPPPVPRDFADPARAEAGELSPAFDVFGLGALARFLAPDPPPGHVLGRIAAEATDDDVSARPQARAVAEVLQLEVPAARLPRGLDPGPPAARPRPAAATDPLAALRHGRPARPHRRPPVRAVVAAVVAVGAVGVAVLLAPSATPTAPAPLTDLGAPADPVPPETPAPGPTTTRARPVSTTSSTRPVITRPAGCQTPTAVLQADVDGDGCPDALRYANGILEAGGVRWSLGQAGDQVATGDWACQGSRTLALFRPSTGELFRFDGWAAPGRDLTATAVAKVAGGQLVRAADVDRDGCHEVVVERASGGAEVIDLRRAQP
jgi:hypothetical protein